MEVIGGVSAVIAIADLGLRTATALGNFAAAAKASSSTVRIVCSDINALAGILYQIAGLSNATVRRQGVVVSVFPKALLFVVETSAQNCEGCFKRVEEALHSASSQIRNEGLSQADQLELSTWEKLRWPFVKDHIKDVQEELEVSKITLNLALSTANITKEVEQSEGGLLTNTHTQQNVLSIKRAMRKDLEDLKKYDRAKLPTSISKAVSGDKPSTRDPPMSRLPDPRGSPPRRTSPRPQPIIIEEEIRRRPPRSESSLSSLSTYRRFISKYDFGYPAKTTRFLSKVSSRWRLKLNMSILDEIDVKPDAGHLRMWTINSSNPYFHAVVECMALSSAQVYAYLLAKSGVGARSVTEQLSKLNPLFSNTILDYALLKDLELLAVHGNRKSHQVKYPLSLKNGSPIFVTREHGTPRGRDRSRTSDLRMPLPPPPGPQTEYAYGTNMALAPPRRPVYPRVERRFASPETLNYFGLDWEYDRSDPNWIIIKQEMSRRHLDDVFDHERNLQSRAQDGQLVHQRRGGRSPRRANQVMVLPSKRRSRSSERSGRRKERVEQQRAWQRRHEAENRRQDSQLDYVIIPRRDTTATELSEAIEIQERSGLRSSRIPAPHALTERKSGKEIPVQSRGRSRSPEIVIIRERRRSSTSVSRASAGSSNHDAEDLTAVDALLSEWTSDLPESQQGSGAAVAPGLAAEALSPIGEDSISETPANVSREDFAAEQQPRRSATLPFQLSAPPPPNAQVQAPRRSATSPSYLSTPPAPRVDDNGGIEDEDLQRANEQPPLGSGTVPAAEAAADASGSAEVEAQAASVPEGRLPSARTSSGGGE